eukprot:1158079-Pelagomonas_calceolata.AAC.6
MEEVVLRNQDYTGCSKNRAHKRAWGLQQAEGLGQACSSCLAAACPCWVAVSTTARAHKRHPHP